MLTARQRLFINEYLMSLNGTHAAIRAGYSPRTARAIASENLRKPAIAAEISRRMEASQKASSAQVERVIAELARIAFSDITGVLGPGGHIKPPEEWPRETWYAVKSVNYSERTGPADSAGKRKRIRYRANIRAHDKIRALSALGEHLGMFPRPTRTGPGRKR
jgi:phage terminase small subunit